VLAALLPGLAALFPGRPLGGGGTLLLETESAHNYIRVEQEGQRVVLRLNEGRVEDSVYRPGRTWPGGLWDEYLLAPLLRSGGRRLERVLVLGGGAGTIARTYAAVYDPEVIHQVEIDPAIVAAGRRYFDLRGPVFEMDARVYLRTTETAYDVIVLDAYRVPYVPFHLATREYFQLLRDRLRPGGVVVANVFGPPRDRGLVDALGATMASVFPAVYELPPPALGLRGRAPYSNTLLFALECAERRAPPYAPDHEACRKIGGDLLRLRPFSGGGPVLTDDRAPVEEIVHGMLWRHATGR
jgi:spermidine synthase